MIPLVLVHFVFGLAAGPLLSITQDGQLLQRTPAADILAFASEGGGRFIISPDTLEVPACPDLKCPEIAWQVTGGCTPQIHARIWNDSDAPSPPSVVAFTVQGLSTPLRHSVPALAAHESVWSDWLTVPGLLAGKHPWSACADADNQVTERDESNNCYTR